MESNEHAAKASDLRAQLPFTTDRRRLKQLREQIASLERQSKLIEQRQRRESER